MPQTLNGYDLSGARVWFRFRANANGPVPEIIYFNGRRVALGDDLEPIVLFDDAKPGDKVLVAVKLLPTVDEKRIAGVDLSLEFAQNRPNPADLLTEFETAALLIPTLSKDVSADQATLAKAIGDVNVPALDRKDQTKFDASLKQRAAVAGAAEADAAAGRHAPDRQLAHRRSLAVAVDRDGGCGEADIRTAAQLMNEYPDLHLHAIGGAVQPVDRGQVSGAE